MQIFHQHQKKVKTKIQKVLGANSDVCGSCRGKGNGIFLEMAHELLSQSRKLNKRRVGEGLNKSGAREVLGKFF